MKKMMAAALLAMVLGVCAPAQGNHLLIYKVKFTAKGVDGDATTKLPVKGFMIMDIDTHDNIVDVNLLLYGKDNDANKVFIELDEIDSVGDLLDVTDEVLGTSDEHLIIRMETTELCGINAELVGKRKLRDVGAGDLKLAASSIKGVMGIWSGMLFYDDQEIYGTSTITLSLHTKATKYYNGLSATSDDAVQGFRTWLGELDYEEFELLK
jgi:hypothetical protein